MRRLAVALVAALALVGAACGNGNDDNPALEQGSPPPAHNDADVAFAQGMVPHHEQAIHMSDLALRQAASAKVKDLARRIKDDKEREITQMKGWLAQWGNPPWPSTVVVTAARA